MPKVLANSALRLGSRPATAMTRPLDDAWIAGTTCERAMLAVPSTPQRSIDAKFSSPHDHLGHTIYVKRLRTANRSADAPACQPGSARGKSTLLSQRLTILVTRLTGRAARP